jgi:hypothetical protein
MKPTQHASRVLHLDYAIRSWLGEAAKPEAGERVIGAHASRWLREAGEGPHFERLFALVAELHAVLPAAQGRSAADFNAAFARALLHQAFAEVAREAVRSGRADAFVCLKPYLQGSPGEAELAVLSRELSMTPQAIGLALAGMRRRLRGRIEAALDLWSGGPESRDTLRRHMRAALREGTP